MRVHRRVLARPEPRVEHPHLIILKKKLVVLGGSRSAVIDSNAIMSNILVIRSHGVLLDSDLGALYQVETKAPTRAVRRNAGRFPGDFMFQLTAEESDSLRSQFGALKTGRGKHRKYAP